MLVCSVSRCKGWAPETHDTADHSLPYVVCTALLDGTVDQTSFSETHIRDPHLALLMAKCLSGNFSLKTLDESRHGLPNMLLSGTSFNFAIWKSESNQTHVSGRTLRLPCLRTWFSQRSIRS